MGGRNDPRKSKCAEGQRHLDFRGSFRPSTALRAARRPTCPAPWLRGSVLRPCLRTFPVPEVRSVRGFCGSWRILLNYPFAFFDGEELVRFDVGGAVLHT